MAKPMTHAQIGQLGGFASARAAGHEELSERGTVGGETTRARYGREHYIKMAHARWGRNVKTTAGRGSTDASHVEASPVAVEGSAPSTAQRTAPAARGSTPLAPAHGKTYAAKQSKSTDIS